MIRFKQFYGVAELNYLNHTKLQFDGKSIVELNDGGMQRLPVNTIKAQGDLHSK
jgi:hypothetical protein